MLLRLHVVELLDIQYLVLYFLTNIKLISISYIILYIIYTSYYYNRYVVIGVYVLRAHAQWATGDQFTPTFRCQGAPRATLSMAFSAITATRPPAWDRQGATGRLKKTQISKPVFHTWCEHFISNECQLHRWENILNRSHVVVKHQPRQYIFHRSRNPNFNALHAHQITRQRL